MLETTSLIDSQDNSLCKGFSFNMLKCQKSNSSIHLSWALNVQILLKLPQISNWGILTTARTNWARLALPPKGQLQNMQHSAYQVWSLALTGHRKDHFCHKRELVCGFNPSEKYARQNGNLPQIGLKINMFSWHKINPWIFFPKKNLPSHRERRYYRPGNPFFLGGEAGGID